MFSNHTIHAVLSALLALAITQTATADGGTIKGVVKWEGKVPKRKKLPTSADPYCARMHANTPLLSEKRVINENNTVKNTFVYIKSGLPDGKTWPTPSEPVVLDQNGCRYEPHVFGIMPGQGLLVKNSDDTAHNINCTPKNNNGFNQGQPKKGMQFTKQFNTAEVMIPFKCDVHPWMSAYCAVMDHPFFSVTDDEGKFEITGLPPGEYEVVTWHEEKRFKSQTQKIVVSEGETKEIEFTFSRGKR